MTCLCFTYHEVIDSDFTAITATVHSDGRARQHFANFDRRTIVKPIYANQSETFEFQTHENALNFLRSNEAFRELPEQPIITD